MENSITIKNVTLGQGSAKICVPMIGKNEIELLEEIETVLEVNPDVLEWRADYLDEPTEENILALLDKLSSFIAHLPLIFTLRIQAEGGQAYIPQDDRLRIIQKVLESGKVDVVDIELINGSHFIQTILNTAHKNNAYVILSNHHFTSTPTQEEILDRLKTMEQNRCDIAKIACMPTNSQDVLALLSAMTAFTQAYPSTPVIGISMSQTGLISRVAAGVFGSCLTFGIASRASAPGQISVQTLRTVLSILAP